MGSGVDHKPCTPPASHTSLLCSQSVRKTGSCARRLLPACPHTTSAVCDSVFVASVRVRNENLSQRLPRKISQVTMPSETPRVDPQQMASIRSTLAARGLPGGPLVSQPVSPFACWRIVGAMRCSRGGRHLCFVFFEPTTSVVRCWVLCVRGFSPYFLLGVLTPPPSLPPRLRRR